MCHLRLALGPRGVPAGRRGQGAVPGVVGGELSVGVGSLVGHLVVLNAGEEVVHRVKCPRVLY